MLEPTVHLQYECREVTSHVGSSAEEARGTSSKLILYGTLLENMVEFVREFVALKTLKNISTYCITIIAHNCK